MQAFSQATFQATRGYRNTLFYTNEPFKQLKQAFMSGKQAGLGHSFFDVMAGVVLHSALPAAHIPPYGSTLHAAQPGEVA